MCSDGLVVASGQSPKHVLGDTGWEGSGQTLGCSPEAVACLSVWPPHREELNLAVLHAFVDLHEFTDLNLVQALR